MACIHKNQILTRSFFSLLILCNTSFAASPVIKITPYLLETGQRILHSCQMTYYSWSLKQKIWKDILDNCNNASKIKVIKSFRNITSNNISYNIGFIPQKRNHINQNGIYGDFQSVSLNFNKEVNSWSSISLQTQLASTEHDPERKNETLYFNNQNVFFSFGKSFFEVDIGYREHWFGTSPLSNFIFTNNSQSMPSITFSNSKPIPFFGKLYYETFVAKQNYNTLIRSDNVQSTGRPLLIGTMMAIKPSQNFTLSAYRLLQFGGGHREVDTSLILEAFINPRVGDNLGFGEAELGNQTAAISSSFQFNIDNNSFQLYTSFAGEDTEGGIGYRLGNNAFTAGLSIFIPEQNQLLITADYSLWQLGWYTHHIYTEGLIFNKFSVGHWYSNYLSPGKEGYAFDMKASIQSQKTIWGLSLKLLGNATPPEYSLIQPGFYSIYQDKHFFLQTRFQIYQANLEQYSSANVSAGWKWQ